MIGLSKQTRIALYTAMVVVGATLVAVAVLVTEIRLFPALTVALGALLISLGVTGSIRLLPRADRRANRVLRAEVDQLIKFTRDLYRHRTVGDSAMIHETKAQMRETLDRIIKAASLYQEEPEKAASPAADE